MTFLHWLGDITKGPSLTKLFLHPARALVRISISFLGAWVLYMFLIGVFSDPETIKVTIWLGLFSGFIGGSEFLRRQYISIYEKSVTRFIRVFLLTAFISVLLNFESKQEHVLVILYLVPLFATIVYFPRASKERWILFGLIFVAMLFVLIIFGENLKDKLYAIPLILIFLSFCLFIFERFHRQGIFSPSTRLIKQARKLHNHLDLSILLPVALDELVKVTGAKHVILIVINPETKTYILHEKVGFQFYELEKIEEFVRTFLNKQETFKNNKIFPYGLGGVFQRYLLPCPKSYEGTLFLGLAGEPIGLSIIAQESPFDEITRDAFHEFTDYMESAISNCLTYHASQIRRARQDKVSEQFIGATNRDEIVSILENEIKHHFSSDSVIVFHEFVLDSSINEYVLKPLRWMGLLNEQIPPTLQVEQGIAGHAIKLLEPVLVNDVENHPWYVPVNPFLEIKSILSAPLFDENNKFGTLSIYCQKKDAFSEEHEMFLSSLASQASKVIAKIVEFEEWRKHGGGLHKILYEVRYFDLGSTDEALSEQIVNAAVRLLGYKLARIRLYEPEKESLVSYAVAGVDESTAKILMKQSIPLEQITPFFDEKYQMGRSYLIPPTDPHWRHIANQYFYLSEQVDNSPWNRYSALITPLYTASGKLLGVLTVDAPKDGSYPSPQSIEAIGIFSSFAAWALDISRYQRRLASQKERAKSFIETISEELSQGHDLETIGDVVVQVGAKLINVEGCNLHLVRGNEIELCHSSYLAGTDYIGRRKPLSNELGCGLTAWVAYTGETLMLNNEKYKNHHAWAGEHGHLRHLESKDCKSVVLSPLRDQKQNVIGVISLENKKGPHGEYIDFDGDDISRLESLARQYAIAFERIGRYEAAMRWQSLGLEEDLHFLINWHRFGVLSYIDELEIKLNNNDIDAIKEMMPGLLRNARNTVNELKALHTLIINHCLEADNLQDGLQSLIDAWRKRTAPKYPPKYPLQIHLNHDCDIDVAPAIRNKIIRIASDALSNAIAHSGIQQDQHIRIDINIFARNNNITLEIRDTGKGMDRKTPEGFGIQKMKQLTNELNNLGWVKAKLDIQSKVGSGTAVLLAIQLLGDDGRENEQ